MLQAYLLIVFGRSLSVFLILPVGKHDIQHWSLTVVNASSFLQTNTVPGYCLPVVGILPHC